MVLGRLAIDFQGALIFILGGVGELERTFGDLGSTAKTG